MSDTPMPITGFAIDVIESDDGRTMVAVLAVESGEQTFEFAINADGARAMTSNLEKFLAFVESRGGRAN